MIDIKRLKPEDKGRWVSYRPDACGDELPEVGRIKSWNDRFIFVVFDCDGNWDRWEEYTAMAVYPEDLWWFDWKKRKSWSDAK
jgi:hypothetical protein